MVVLHSNKKRKSLKRKTDVGMACQKLTQTRKGGYKSEGQYTKLAPSLHLLHTKAQL